MSRQLPQATASDATSARFDWAIEWLMIALLVFMPLALGAVEAWSELIVVALVGAMAFCLTLKLVCVPDARLLRSWAYLPIALFLLVVVLQLVPLPASVVAALSPGTAALKTKLLGDLPNAAGELRTMTLSFYPSATRHNLRLILCAIVVFIVVLNVYRTPGQVKRLLGAVAIVGGIAALLAVAQNVFGNGRIYWLIPTPGGKGHSGPFICHSHYGQFMNLSIGAMLGLVLIKLHEAFRHGSRSVAEVVERLGSPSFRVVWCLAAAIVIAAVTVFLSMTRGGVVSMLIAAGFTTLVLASRRALRGRGWIMLALALVSFICILYAGFDAVYDRLATLRDLHHYEGRWQIVKDISVSFTRFPVLGTGLGTHEVVYPMFDRSTIPGLAAHAENEYAQIAEEAGIVGLVLLVAFLAITWRNYAHSVRHHGLSVRSAAFGLGFGLLAVMIHSLSDFGQHLPANACLTALSCGLLAGLARMGRPRCERASWLRAVAGSRPVRVAALIATGAVVAWALHGANNARCAQAHWAKARAAEAYLSENGWRGSDRDYAYLITHAAAASRWEPGNVKYRHWLNVYRWRSISRDTDPATGEVSVTPRTLEFTRRIVDELHKARALCPTFGATYCVVGQLERLILRQPSGADRIRTGYTLAPCDPTATYVAGRLAAREGHLADSLKKFRRCIALDAGLASDVIDVYISEVKRPDLALAFANGNTGLLTRVARALDGQNGRPALAAKARAQAVALLKATCERPDADAGTLASMADIALQEEDRRAAVGYYRRALALQYDQVTWRFALARTLAKMGHVPEAMREARVCLRFRPQMAAARKLIADLSGLPHTGPDE